MGSFEYNEIRVDAVDDVELVSSDSSDYMQFKQEIYDTTDDIPPERERMIDDPRSTAFVNIAEQLVGADCEKLIEQMFVLRADIPNYVTNPDQLREGLLTSGRNTDVDVVYGDLTPSVRGKCKHAKDDGYRPDDDDALCCWECSTDDTRKPEKFMRSDPPCESCTLAVPMKFQLKKKLAETLRIGHTGFLSSEFRESDLSAGEIQSYLASGSETRSRLIQLAFRVAYPDEDYYYQRAEALLRDLGADVAKESGPGAGGRKFEYEAIERLNKKFELRDETVFKITFDEDSEPVYWQDFVSGPSQATFKEADAIIEGDVGPIVVDFFTQRHTVEKREQVSNYAELYEKATGEEPRAWGITDDTYAELIELDTLVGDDTGDRNDLGDGQTGISDFL